MIINVQFQFELDQPMTINQISPIAIHKWVNESYDSMVKSRNSEARVFEFRRARPRILESQSHSLTAEREWAGVPGV